MSEKLRAYVYKPPYAGDYPWWVETFSAIRPVRLAVFRTWAEAMRHALNWTEKGTR